MNDELGMASPEDIGKGDAAQARAEESEFAQWRRRETFRKVTAWIALFFIGLLAVIFAIVIATVAWHYLAPPDRGYLSDDQLATLRLFLFSGLAATMTSWLFGYIRDQL